MKRLAGWALCIFMTVGLCACASEGDQDSVDVQAGVYVLEHFDGGLAVPNLILSDDDRFTFTYSILSSNIPAGSYDIEDDHLVLTVDTEGGDAVSYVFEIDDGKFIYRQDQSAALPAFASDEMYDGAVFVYAAPVPEED